MSLQPSSARRLYCKTIQHCVSNNSKAVFFFNSELFTRENTIYLQQSNSQQLRNSAQFRIYLQKDITGPKNLLVPQVWGLYFTSILGLWLVSTPELVLRSGLSLSCLVWDPSLLPEFNLRFFTKLPQVSLPRFKRPQDCDLDCSRVLHQHKKLFSHLSTAVMKKPNHREYLPKLYSITSSSAFCASNLSCASNLMTSRHGSHHFQSACHSPWIQD